MNPKVKTVVVSLRISPSVRGLLERLTVHLSNKQQKPLTMTKALVEAIRVLAKKEGIPE